MKRPAVFFDRDNTLIVSDGYLGDPAKVVLVNGAADAVARARKFGFAVVVFSNQSGVARGMFSEEDVQAVNKRMDELLVAENPDAIIDRHEFCPFHPEGTIDVYTRDSDRRKPKPGMIHSAAEKLALDLPRCWVIGDAPRDIEAGKAAGCRAILFTDGLLQKSPAAEEAAKVQPDYVVTTLAEAMDYIERSTQSNLKAPLAGSASRAVASVAREEMPPPAPSVAPVSATGTAVEDEPAEEIAAAAPPARVPKVAIGSKYVSKETPSRENGAGSNREETVERPVVRKFPKREEPEARPAGPPPSGSERMESLLEQIFLELRRRNEHGDHDFSVSKLLAGVVQVIVLATLLLAYLRGREAGTVQIYMTLALVLQTLTISLLIMSRQK